MLDEDKLPEDNEIITNNVSISTARSTDIASFTSKTGFSINKKKMRRLMEMDEKAYESFKLEAFISKCCRVIIPWKKIYADINYSRTPHYLISRNWTWRMPTSCTRKPRRRRWSQIAPPSATYCRWLQVSAIKEVVSVTDSTSLLSIRMQSSRMVSNCLKYHVLHIIMYSLFFRCCIRSSSSTSK